MGDGAGCISAVSHLASTTSQHFFQSAILQSCPLNIPFRNKTEARKQAEVFSAHLNCRVNDVTCYRTKSANEILRAQQGLRVNSYTTNPLHYLYPWGPSIDDDQVFYHPMDVFADLSRFSNKPILIGNVANEGTASVYKMFPLPLSQDRFHAIIQQITSQPPPTFFAPTNGDMRNTLADFIQEYVFMCPTLYAAKQIIKKQAVFNRLPFPASSDLTSSSSSTTSNNSPLDANTKSHSGNRLWMYEFFRPSLTPASALWASLSSTHVVCERHSCHGSDVRAIFNSDVLPVFEKMKLESLSQLMIRYWSNFARTRNVNGGITSRTHLRSLQLQAARRTESSSSSLGTPNRSPKSQTVRFNPSLTESPSSLAARNIIKSALASFTFWPDYAKDEGKESQSLMLLQNSPLVVIRNPWELKCKTWHGWNH